MSDKTSNGVKNAKPIAISRNGPPLPSKPLDGEMFDHHLAGERVTTIYVDLDSGKWIEVPLSESVPLRAIPFLGDVNVDDEST